MKSEKILVVDDNDDHRNAIEYLLKKEGYSVIPAGNGETGLEELEKRDDIQILITDLAMLKISGVQLLEKIKDHKQPLRRIVLTAYDEELPYDQAEELHVFAYLNKPISKTTLIFTVNSAFNDLHLEEAKKWEELGQVAIDFVKLLENKVGVILGHIHAIKKVLGHTTGNIDAKFKEIDDIVEQIVGSKRTLLTPFERTTMEKVNIKEIIELSIDLIPIAEGLELIKNYGSKEYIVNSNSFSLQKVFEDVILNAIEAMQDVETKRLTISISEEPGKTVRITIHDTGRGISKLEKDKIFRPFYTTKGREHFGLGLFCAKNTITKFGGTITFQSHKEEDTSFIIDLPLLKKET
jgi:signal transduction histidine kinase